MADFLSRVGRFISQTPVQRSKAPENKQPIEKRADGKRSHSMASHSSVKSLKSRVISIGSPKKARPTPASKPASDTSPELQLTPAEFFAKEDELARNIKENDENRLDRELAALTQGLDDEELLLSFDPKRIAADSEKQAPKLAYRPQQLEAPAMSVAASATSEADDAISSLEAQLGRALADTKSESATDSAQKSLNSIPRERAMPGQHRVIQRGLPRRPKPLPKPPNLTSPERRGPVGRTVPTKPPETRGGDGK